MYDIEFYEDENGKSEVYEYIHKLKTNINKENKQKLKKIDMYIDLLSEYGLNLKEPYIKKLNKNIWELRPLRDRILFVSWCNNRFILLSVFMKKSSKTPISEIRKAEKLFDDYVRRYKYE